MKRWILALALAFLVPLSAFAQTPLSVLQAERAKYPALINQTQAGQLLDAVASRLGGGWGLLRKPGGNRCPQPGTGIDVSCDWLVNKDSGLGCDVLGSGPDTDNSGPANPQWCGGDPFDRNAWVAPTGSTPPPPPPPPPDTEVLRAIANLSARLTDLGSQIDQLTRLVTNGTPELVRAIDDLRAEVNALRAKPITFPVYKGRVLGQSFTLTPQQQ